MDLKAKIARSRKIADIKHEMETYMNAINANSKYSDFYRGKVTILEAKLEAILA